LALGIGGLAAAGDDEKEATRAKKRRNFLDRFCAKGGGQNLKRISLEYKIKFLGEGSGRVQQIAHVIFHETFGIPLSGCANGRFGDVERSRAISPHGQLFGVVAKAAADDQREFPCGLLRMILPKAEKVRIRAKIRPRHEALPCRCFLIEGLEPASRVAFAEEFSGEFAGTCAVRHFESFYRATPTQVMG